MKKKKKRREAKQNEQIYEIFNYSHEPEKNMVKTFQSYDRQKVPLQVNRNWSAFLSGRNDGRKHQYQLMQPIAIDTFKKQERY